MTIQAARARSTDPHLCPARAWRKSSYSSQDNGNCVEVAPLDGVVGIRDSKDKEGAALLVTAAGWASFVGLVRSGAVDFGVV
ncbi:hypothetical protein RVR_7520 [Actinacidiphila reveromycinica]|uniref:DUF397 domain-containing protein n=1 Tax=Actinacidiphila reveromycinica TaxID=659352 RepID=A0A7U3UX89_9ACTN|nr:DUF397 domain-containing protein [Streptomyces sp. SN-593]BBB00452.1 hypothetical protein RVR_7520 [Streptomyces sp. SN-593]